MTKTAALAGSVGRVAVLLLWHMVAVMVHCLPPDKEVFLHDDSSIIAQLKGSTLRLLGYSLSAKYGNRLFLYDGNITRAPTDAIANSASEECLGVASKGVDGAIHAAIGYDPQTGHGLFKKEIEVKLKPLGRSGKRCPVGTARAVRVPWHRPAVKRHLAHNVKYVLQAVGPSTPNPTLLEKTYWNVFDRAGRLGVRHVALPCISTGRHGFPKTKAAEIAVRTAKRWIAANPTSRLKIVFVLRPGAPGQNAQVASYKTAFRRYLN